jgi:hypothetical protein
VQDEELFQERAAPTSFPSRTVAAAAADDTAAFDIENSVLVHEPDESSNNHRSTFGTATAATATASASEAQRQVRLVCSVISYCGTVVVRSTLYQAVLQYEHFACGALLLQLLPMRANVHETSRLAYCTRYSVTALRSAMQARAFICVYAQLTCAVLCECSLFAMMYTA